MHEAYSKPCQTSKQMRHIENPWHSLRTVYSDIFRHMQRHSAILSHAQANFQPCLGILRDMKAY